jgi:hypothetical protein
MSYEVGTYIDLTGVNKQPVSEKKIKAPQEKGRSLYAIGTEFIFNTTPEGFKAAIRIPVMAA